MYFQEAIKELTPPWNLLFAKTKLIYSAAATLLVVPENQFSFFQSLEALNKIYPIAKAIYPDTTSLMVVFGSEYSYVEDGKLEIVDVKVLKNNG